MESRRLLLANGVTLSESCVIYYTSSDGKIVQPYKTDVFGANIISNTYDYANNGVITFDGDVTSIGDHAFYSCSSLISITIHDSVTSIGDGAFEDCDALKDVNVNITNLAEYCKGNAIYNIPGNKHLYINNKEITELVIPNSVTSIGDGAFYDCSSLTSITIPNNVISIGDYAFYSCSSLTNITIPDSVTKIGDGIFLGCTSLTSVTIPDSVTTIGEYAFYYCTSLTSVNIPDSVTSIGEDAFADCDCLTSVYCYASIPPSLGGTYVFDNNGSGRKIYVPTGSVDAYKSAANWSKYNDAIIGYDFENNTVIE